MIMKDELCFHCESLLSDITDTRALGRYIGQISALDTATYLEYCKDLSLLISLRFQGQQRFNSLEPEEISHIRMKENANKICYVDVNGNSYTPRLIPREQVLNDLLSLDGTSEKTHFKWAAMMKLSRAVPPEEGPPSKTVLMKHVKSITEPFNGSEDFIDSLEKPIRIVTQRLIQKSELTAMSREKFYLPITHFPAVNKSSTCITSDGLKAYSAPRTSLEPFNLKGIMRHPRIQDLYLCDPDTFISRAFVGTRVRNGNIDLEEYPRIDHDTPLSIIGFIPNPGDKRRVVANSTLLVQSLSYTIGRVAKKINSSWKVQGVDSHEDTCDHLHSLLSSFHGRKTFYSIDMSNFTDRMPYNGLISVVVDELTRSNILLPFDKVLMDLICEGPILLDNQVRRYGVGTPMGTFPSFPLASMANGIIATIAYALSRGRTDLDNIDLDRIPCRIIGDDIVIWDDKTAHVYELIMENIGLEVQPSKCITSAYVAEMCSKIITYQGVFQQKKIDSLYLGSDVQSFIEQYRFYEDDTLLQYRPELVDLIEALRDIPAPIGLAPKVDDFSNNYWLDHISELQIYTAIKVANDFKVKFDLTVDSVDFELLRNRRKLLPKSLEYEVEETYEPYHHSPVIESLLRDIQIELSIIHAREDSTPEEKLEASERILSLTTAFKETYHFKSIDQIDSISEDYHLHQPVDPVVVEESGLETKKSFEDLLNQLHTLNNQFKEVKKDEQQVDLPV